MIKLPDYDPKKYPVTEALLGLYDLATRWANEEGLPHRETFRFACQLCEMEGKNKALENELAAIGKKITEKKGELVELQALIKGNLFKG